MQQKLIATGADRRRADATTSGADGRRCPTGPEPVLSARAIQLFREGVVASSSSNRGGPGGPSDVRDGRWIIVVELQDNRKTSQPRIEKLWIRLK